MRRKVLSLVVLLALLSGGAARAFWPFFFRSGIEERQTEESALLRVYLKSLGDPVSMGVTFSGIYTLEGDAGFRFARDTATELTADGENVLLTCGGMTINMGTSLTLTRHKAGEGEENGLRLHDAGRDVLYEGDLTVSASGGALRPVLTIDIEDYLLGVVPYEMSDSFPIEALKAQAVAARTYAMARKALRGNFPYDVVDTTADQVFKGRNALHENAALAAQDTRGVVLLYKGGYATAYFGASNGGETAMPDMIWGYAGDYGYLDAHKDPYDLENPYSVVKRLEIPKDAALLSEKLRQRIGRDAATITAVTPMEPKKENTSMYTKILVAYTKEDGTEGSATLDFYADLKPNFGLSINSANIETVSVSEEEGIFAVEARRFGHGVGMSQRGAQQMAGVHNKMWQDILAFYYPKAEIVRMEYAREELKEIAALSKNVGAARPMPTPKPTPAPLRALKEGEYYAKVALGSKSSTLNVRQGAGLDYAIVALLTHGDSVIVKAEEANGWVKIETAETEGYVSLEYLEKQG
ncbi:MAG: SpoIID/LytB domain-containing protein [Christensenellales bacterium]|jgi:stage II sporulation protein D